MHALVRRYLKTAIGFLAVGLALGLWMIERERYGRGAGTYLVSAHTHAILVGFVMMMILGVALWMFPRPARDDDRYRPAVAAGAYWLVSLGTALRVTAMQVNRLGLFFFTMWSRIRPVGSRAREEHGERF
ncbi:MAG: hypothetical protein ABI637_05345 [Gemmatimonadota bacterium]